MFVLTLLGGIFTLLGYAGAAYALGATYLAGRFARARSGTAGEFPPISILKPLHGPEPSLERNLETFFVQDYPALVQLVFGASSPDDAAIAVVERLRAGHPAANVVVVIDDRHYGANPKVSNLIGMRTAAQHDVLVLSDSDIAVAPDYLRKIAAALTPPEVGAVTCVYTGWAAAGFGSRLSAMGINYHFLPNVITGVALRLTAPCFGSTIAIKKAVLDEIGGFAAFASHLADDHEIGRAVRAKKHRVVIPPFAVEHACGEASFGEWFHHELRWMRTIRTVDPGGHAGSIVTHGFSLALVGAILSGFSDLSLSVVLTTLLARAMLKWRIDSLFAHNAGPYWLLPIRDVLSFGVFVTSLFGASVVWKNERLRVHEDGALSNR
jgi:ceramide glucosyltransferase